MHDKFQLDHAFSKIHHICEGRKCRIYSIYMHFFGLCAMWFQHYFQSKPFWATDFVPHMKPVKTITKILSHILQKCSKATLPNETLNWQTENVRMLYVLFRDNEANQRIFIVDINCSGPFMENVLFIDQWTIC